MRRSFVTLAALLIFSAARIAGAHPHHDTPMSSEDALASAVLVVDDLVTRRNIEASWKGVWPASTERVMRNGQMEWVVILKNPAIPDAAKQTLYVIFDFFGEFLVANHTGNSN